MIPRFASVEVEEVLPGIRSFKELAGHPVAGPSLEGMVIENLLQCAPGRTRASFYRTAAGAEGMGARFQVRSEE
jgi:hypothetical protein